MTVPGRDQTRREVLAESGYEISVLGVAPEDPGVETIIANDASRGRCIAAIRTACGRVPEGGTLLVYFSGHGFRQGGRDYLVPSEASMALDGAGADPDSLLDLDVAKHVGHCQARSWRSWWTRAAGTSSRPSTWDSCRGCPGKVRGVLPGGGLHGR